MIRLRELPARAIPRICASSVRRPWVWAACALLLVLLSLQGVARLGLDTNLIRLLPRSSPASENTRELETVVGGGGSFTVMFEGEDREALLAAVGAAAERIEGLDEVRSAVYRHPTGYYEKFRYLLIPAYYLEKIYDLVLEWQAEVNPFAEYLDDADEGEDTYGSEEARKDTEALIHRYGNLPPYYESEDGTVVAILVRPHRSVTSLSPLRTLFADLQRIAREEGRKHGLWSGVAGSLRNKIDEYDLIVSDLSRSGTITTLAILLTLVLSFASLRILPVLLFPLAAGLIVSFALVPVLVGDLNAITSFLLLVLLGMGIDYSIHLVKRFRLEVIREGGSPLAKEKVLGVLTRTYLSAGTAVLASGLTTALALGVLAVSDFRGFSDFGLIGSMAVLMILAAMFLVMPATLVLGERAGAMRLRGRLPEFSWIPGRGITALLLTATAAAAVIAFFGARFDYDFSNLKARVPESVEVKKRQRKVFTNSGTPAAVYVAADVESLDRSLEIFGESRKRSGSTFGRIFSARDFAPDRVQASRRLELIAEIAEETAGSWTARIEDPERRRWVKDFNDWVRPARTPRFSDIPTGLKSRLFSKDGSNRFIIGIFPNIERSHGKNAMAFTRELYGIEAPEGLQGPMGETPVFAEILWIVTSEGPLLVGFSLIGIFLLVLYYQRSVRETLWILVPLLTGVVLTFGVIALAGVKLNFFSVVVIPSLLGLGVDDGVHYFRRWKELGGNTRETQRELFVPLTVTSLTTVMGYSGMVFASHSGLFSIGQLACIGLGLVWATSVFLLPGLLRWRERATKG